MTIEIYGDSYVYGGGLNCEYALKKGYIKNYYDHEKLNKMIQKNTECDIFVKNNRWTKLLEKELNIEIKNCGFGGGSWQYIIYVFFRNQMYNYNKKDVIYIFCPPRVFFKRLLVSNERELLINKLNIVNHENFASLNLYGNINIIDDDFENKMKILFDKNVINQLNFQSAINLINYLINNNLKFLFLPSWGNNLKESFILSNKIEEEENSRNNIDLLKSSFFKFFEKREIDETNEIDDKDIFFSFDKEIEKLYNYFIFNKIRNISFNNNWKKYGILPSGHPDLKSQEIIKNEYIKYIQEMLM
jgi:hypothetical protein